MPNKPKSIWGLFIVNHVPEKEIYQALVEAIKEVKERRDKEKLIADKVSKRNEALAKLDYDTVHKIDDELFEKGYLPYPTILHESPWSGLLKQDEEAKAEATSEKD